MVVVKHYIQFTYIVLFERAVETFGELFWTVLQRVHILNLVTYHNPNYKEEHTNMDDS